MHDQQRDRSAGGSGRPRTYPAHHVTAAIDAADVALGRSAPLALPSAQSIGPVLVYPRALVLWIFDLSRCW